METDSHLSRSGRLRERMRHMVLISLNRIEIISIRKLWMGRF